MKTIIASVLSFILGGMLVASMLSDPNVHEGHTTQNPGTASTDDDDASQPKAGAGTLRELESTSDQVSQSPKDLWSLYNQSRDRNSLLENLVELGFPNDIIRNIIHHVVQSEKFRENPDLLRSNNPQWWRPQRQGPEQRSRMLRISQEIDKEINELLKQLPPEDETEAQKKSRVAVYGSMSREKANLVRDLELDFNEMRTRLMTENEGELTLEEKKLLHDQRLAELRAILTTDELLEYEARTGVYSHVIKGQLKDVVLTESEYLKVAEVYIDLSRVSLYSNQTQAQEATMFADLRRSQLALADTLGEQKLNEVLQATDFAYQNIHDFATDREIPPDITRSLWDIKSRYDIAIAENIEGDEYTSSQVEINEITKARAELAKLLGHEGAEEFLDAVGPVLFDYNPEG